MAAKMSVLGLILSFYPYLRSAMERFPLNCVVDHHLIKFPLYSDIQEDNKNRKEYRRWTSTQLVFQSIQIIITQKRMNIGSWNFVQIVSPISNHTVKVSAPGHLGVRALKRFGLRCLCWFNLKEKMKNRFSFVKITQKSITTWNW